MDLANYFARQNSRARAIQDAVAQVKSDDLRDARVAVIERGLREAVQSAPDLFPDVNFHALAGRVVDLIGG